MCFTALPIHTSTCAASNLGAAACHLLNVEQRLSYSPTSKNLNRLAFFLQSIVKVFYLL